MIFKTARGMINLKKIIGALLCAAVALSVAGCGSASDGAKSESGEVETQSELTKITVADNPFIGAAPLYVAADKGIFEKYGLDVEIASFDDPSQCLSALISGNVDISGSTLDSVVIIADQYRDRYPQVVSIRDDSAGADGIVAKNGIDTVADLKGKTVGVAVNQTTHFLLQQALDQAGISENDLTLMDMTSSDAGVSFISGNLDAAVTWEPYLSNAAEAGVGKMIFSSADAPGSIMDVIVVSQETAEEKPAWVGEFLKALDEANEFIADEETRDEAMEITAEHLDISKEEAEAMLPTVKLYSTSEAAEALGDGGLARNTVEKISDFYVEKDVISDTVDAADILNTGFLEADTSQE